MAHILLIDDDEPLRNTMRRMLELDGHDVVQAADGVEGLKRFHSPGARGGFDAVITDVLMPKMDGARLIVKLRHTHPDLPIIAISGGRRVLSPQFNLETASLAGASRQLAKPFTRQELQSALASAMMTAG